MLGQVVLGILADKLGRRKVYGWELVTVVVASLAISMSSNGDIAPARTPGTGTPSVRIKGWLVGSCLKASIVHRLDQALIPLPQYTLRSLTRSTITSETSGVLFQKNME